MKNNYSNGVLGNSIDIHVDRCDNSAEIRADIKVDEFNSKRIWGQVLNCNGEPVPNSLVKLVRVVCQGNRKYYEGIAHTITDCEGFYQFDVCENLENECYKIIINKAVTGPEKVVKTNGGNCNACASDNRNPNGHGKYDPCRRYEPVVTNYNQNDCDCNNQECGGDHNHGHNHSNNCGCNEDYVDDRCINTHCKDSRYTNYASYTR
ncbi:MAG: hypothetical protein RSF37_01990 [Clostridium sp.]|uniref:hypothetical protein n=1 Tax=Clostridium sp. TaxID=1506 RepID=UPI002FC9CC11